MSQEDKKLLEDIEKLDREIDATALAIQTKVAEQVVRVLDDLRKHPYRVGLTHAKILALALKIEQDRTAEAVKIGQKLAEAQRDNAVKAFEAVCSWRGDSTQAPETRHDYAVERAAFLEKIGVKPESTKPEADHPADGERYRHQS